MGAPKPAKTRVEDLGFDNLNRGVHICTHVQFNGIAYHHTFVDPKPADKTTENLVLLLLFLPDGSSADEERSGEDRRGETCTCVASLYPMY